MIINNFIKSFQIEKEYKIIITIECFLLIEKFNDTQGRLSFWSTLFAISNIKLDKKNKITCIDFCEIKNNYQVKLKINDLLKFKDKLIFKMRDLSSRDESKKLLQIKEIRKMKIDEIEAQIDEFKKLINKGIIDEYIVNTFVILCNKAFNYFYANQDSKCMDYTKLKGDLLKKEKVKNLLYSFNSQIEVFNKLPSLYKYYSI